MKRLLLLFCVIFASVTIGPAWSADGKKPKKLSPTILVKKATKAAPKTVRAPPVKPAASSVAVLSDAREAIAPTKTEALPPTPWQTIAAEQSPVTVVIISPTTPTTTPPPTNPYLQQASYRSSADQSLPMPGASPFESLKSAARLILPDGIGQMHPPLYIKYIKQPKTAYSQNEKPILLFEVSCPTKALFGFDTPIVYAIQLGVDQVIALANTTDILPVELQKVCN